MSLAVRIASEFHQDATRQIQWYLRHADAQVAGNYAGQWIRRWNSLADSLGPRCRFSHPELPELRQYRVEGKWKAAANRCVD